MTRFSDLLVGAVVAALFAAYLHNLINPPTLDESDYSKPPSWPIFMVKTRLSQILRQIADLLSPPAIRMLDRYYEMSQRFAIYVCSQAGWPELLHGGARTCAAMAQHANISVARAHRLIHACISADVFREVSTGKPDIEDAERSYANTPMSDILREDHPFSVKAFVSSEIEDYAPALVHLAATWNDESTIPFAAAHNLPSTRDAVSQYYQNSPKQAMQLNRAKEGLDVMGIFALVHDVQWADYCTTILDIGGGRGSLLAAILNDAPAMTGVLMDLPPVISRTRRLWAEQHPQLADRVSFVNGSFFDPDAVPRTSGVGCFCYVSKVH